VRYSSNPLSQQKSVSDKETSFAGNPQDWKVCCRLGVHVLLRRGRRLDKESRLRKINIVPKSYSFKYL
jgi:hypothetical protein